MRQALSPRKAGLPNQRRHRFSISRIPRLTSSYDFSIERNNPHPFSQYHGYRNDTRLPSARLLKSFEFHEFRLSLVGRNGHTPHPTLPTHIRPVIVLHGSHGPTYYPCVTARATALLDPLYVGSVGRPYVCDHRSSGAATDSIQLFEVGFEWCGEGATIDESGWVEPCDDRTIGQ